MNDEQKGMDDVKKIIANKEIIKDLNLCIGKSTANLNRLTTLLEDNKKAQKSAQDINVAAIFKDELENMNDMIFDNFMELNTSIEGLINKYFKKENPDVTKFMETEKVRFSKLQKEISRSSAKLKEKSLQLEQLDKINQEILPQLIKSSRELDDLIKGIMTKSESQFRALDTRVSEIISFMDEEASKNDAQLAALRSDLEKKNAEIKALQEEISSSAQKTGDMEQNMKELKRSIAERDEAMDGLKARLLENEKAIAGLQRDVSGKDNELVELKRTLGEKENSMEEIKRKLSRAEGDADELKHGIEEKERVIEELKRCLDDSKGLAKKAQELGEMEALNAKQGKELKELQGKLAALNQELVMKNGICQDLERARDSATKELAVELERSKDLKATNENLSADVARLKEKIKSLGEDLSAKEKIADDLSRCNEKLRMLSKDAGKSGELQALLDKQARELDDCKGRVESLSKDLAGRDAVIGGLQQQNAAIAAQAKQTGEAKDAAEKQANELREISDKQVAEIKSLNDQIAGMKNDLAAKDANIENLKQGIATLKALSARPRPLDDLKDAIKQKTDELKASMVAKEDSELKGKYEALQREMKQLLKFLEKSPKQQLLFLVSNLGTTSLDKLVEMTKLDEGLVRNILDDLREANLIDVTSDPSDITKFTVKIIEKLNPIGYLEVKHAGLTLDFESRPLEQAFESLLDIVKTYQDVDPETAGYIIAVLYTRARERKNFTLLRQLGSLIESVKPRSFYLRLVDNLLSASPGESQSEAISNAHVTMPRLIPFNKANEELSETSDDYPKKAPFTIENAWCISIVEEVERPDICGKAGAFSTVSSLLNWAWLAARGSKIKLAIKDATGKVYDVIVAPGKPRNAEVLSKSFKSEAG
nr:hypothetical protein [Candidatus Sigynarchaeum springense]